jgi:hypothetical protein
MRNIPDFGYPGALHFPKDTPQRDGGTWYEHYVFKPTPDVLVLIHFVPVGSVQRFVGTVIPWQKPITPTVLDDVAEAYKKVPEHRGSQLVLGSDNLLLVMAACWDRVLQLTTLPSEVPPYVHGSLCQADA